MDKCATLVYRTEHFSQKKYQTYVPKMEIKIHKRSILTNMVLCRIIYSPYHKSSF